MRHSARKSLGQNFLVDQNIIRLIIESINPARDDCFVEIGPGLGAITRPLLKKVDHLDVIEIDSHIIPQLLENCKDEGVPAVHNIDVLKFDFTEFYRSHNKKVLRIAGNLPYNISTAILFHLLKHRGVIQDMHFMLQKEVVERIVAAPGNRDYGRLSVMLQAYYKVSPLFTIAPQCFRPAPNVTSAILRMVPDDRYSAGITDATVFERLVKTAFSQRRKTLKNNLKDLLPAEQIHAAGIDPGLRAEALAIEDFVRLCRLVS